MLQNRVMTEAWIFLDKHIMQPCSVALELPSLGMKTCTNMHLLACSWLDEWAPKTQVNWCRSPPGRQVLVVKQLRTDTQLEPD